MCFREADLAGLPAHEIQRELALACSSVLDFVESVHFKRSAVAQFGIVNVSLLDEHKVFVLI